LKRHWYSWGRHADIRRHHAGTRLNLLDRIPTLKFENVAPPISGSVVSAPSSAKTALFVEICERSDNIRRWQRIYLHGFKSEWHHEGELNANRT
jgi:hypothetical protein